MKISKNKIHLIMEGVANDLRNALVTSVPVDTGILKNSIKIIPTVNGLSIEMSDYWRNVEYGTNPHVITPKNKKALHWGGKNGPVVKKVNHPGTRPQPFIRPVLNTKLKDIIIKNIKAVMSS